MKYLVAYWLSINHSSIITKTTSRTKITLLALGGRLSTAKSAFSCTEIGSSSFCAVAKVRFKLAVTANQSLSHRVPSIRVSTRADRRHACLRTFGYALDLDDSH